MSTTSRSASSRFQSTPPREGGDLLMILLYSIVDISIHAPREGGDVYRAEVYDIK